MPTIHFADMGVRTMERLTKEIEFAVEDRQLPGRDAHSAAQRCMITSASATAIIASICFSEHRCIPWALHCRREQWLSSSPKSLCISFWASGFSVFTAVKPLTVTTPESGFLLASRNKKMSSWHKGFAPPKKQKYGEAPCWLPPKCR